LKVNTLNLTIPSIGYPEASCDENSDINEYEDNVYYELGQELHGLAEEEGNEKKANKKFRRRRK
jgi:hypothetical protein